MIATFVHKHPLDHKIPPPVFFGLTGLSMWISTTWISTMWISTIWISTFFASGALLPARAVSTGAGVFAFIGLTFLFLGVSAFRKAKTTINPVNPAAASTIVTQGIYRYTRNPMYVGFLCLLIAWAFVVGFPWALWGPLAFALFITRFQIIPEERILLAKFGQSYASYQDQVRRWL